MGRSPGARDGANQSCPFHGRFCDLFADLQCATAASGVHGGIWGGSRDEFARAFAHDRLSGRIHSLRRGAFGDVGTTRVDVRIDMRRCAPEPRLLGRADVGGPARRQIARGAGPGRRACGRHGLSFRGDPSGSPRSRDGTIRRRNGIWRDDRSSCHRRTHASLILAYRARNHGPRGPSGCRRLPATASPVAKFCPAFCPQPAAPSRCLGRAPASAGITFLFAIAFFVMGAFVTIYNYAGFRLLAPPYRLNQTQIGLIFLSYVFGMFASSAAGALADRLGRTSVVVAGSLVTMSGLALTLLHPLTSVIAGIVVITVGFFMVHSVASGWVGRLASRNKSHAASLYLLSYHFGSSILGSLGGWFWREGGWAAVVAFCSTLMMIVLGIAAKLLAGAAENRYTQEMLPGPGPIQNAEALGVGRGCHISDGRLCRRQHAEDPGNSAGSDQVGGPHSDEK